MGSIHIHTIEKKYMTDLYSPMSIYLQLRDQFRDTVLLESADYHTVANSFSFIGIHAIAGVEVTAQEIEYKYPQQKEKRISLRNEKRSLSTILWDFCQQFTYTGVSSQAHFAQSLFGYASFDAVCLFDKHPLPADSAIPLARYRLYQYVLVINHFKNEGFLYENQIEGLPSHFKKIEDLIQSKDMPIYPFKMIAEEKENMTDDDFLHLVDKGKHHCQIGDVFQIVLSRRFSQAYQGDDFNVYRSLRNINPSPYLFYFDYGDYKLMGSSPESQLQIKNGIAKVFPIAGTFKRTGDDQKDKLLADALLSDSKENAEHTMLVDLARNDLARCCTNVSVTKYKEIQYYSHVIHLVSEVQGLLPASYNPFEVLLKSFPAGTLSGAPKFKAIQLIHHYEPTTRGYYGGAIGMIGLNGFCNHAIMIRSFLSKNNHLFFQAGAGIVVQSNRDNELQEIKNKLGALRAALHKASLIYIS